MFYVLKYWVNNTDIGQLNMSEYLEDDAAMSRVSDGFSKRSNGILKGAIGALDGWLVHIVCPSFLQDGIMNTTTFFQGKVSMP